MTAAQKHARALQVRQLRDGRQLVEFDCGHCGETHWVLAPSQLVDCLTVPNQSMWLDGLGHAITNDTER